MACHILDVTGLRCPLPVLRAARVLRGLEAGDTLEVTASDPAAPGDFAAFCASTGHALRESRREGEAWRFVIEKTGDAEGR